MTGVGTVSPFVVGVTIGDRGFLTPEKWSLNTERHP